MTTKTPSGLAASGTTTSDDETIDDSLDEILMNANDRPPEGPAPRPVPKLQLPRPSTATLLGVPLSSLPLPSSGFPRGGMLPISVTSPAARDEVTQIARSALLDDLPEDEDTKVRPLETARQAAASMDDVAVGLSDQASAERDRALRKSFPPASRAAAPEPEFADPDTDGPSPTHDGGTPSGIAIQDEDEDDESTANGRGPLSGAGLPVSVAATKLPLPTLFGRPEPFGARLPMPGGPSAGGGGSTTGSSFAVPAPSPSYTVPAGAPVYAPATPSPAFAPPAVSSAFGGLRSSAPSIPIPAPSGAPAASVSRSAVFNKVQLPLGGLVSFLTASFSIGLFAGIIIQRHATPEPPIVMAVPAAPQPMPVVQPVVVQPQGTVEAPPSNAAPAVAEPLPPPAEPAPAFPTEPSVDEARVARRAAAVAAAASAAPAGGTASSTAPTPRPPRARKPASSGGGGSKQVDSRGVAKGWVDPFAQ
jgi:hypothetical protein